MVHYDPFSSEVMEDPYPIYERLRAEAPVYYLDKYDAWAIVAFRRRVEPLVVPGAVGGARARRPRRC